jgi:hypothetical protein
MKAKAICSILIISIVSFMLTTCDMFGTINATVAGLFVSVQVTNKMAGNRVAERAAIGNEDTIELYLERFAYQHDDLNGVSFNGGYILIVANGDMTDDDGYYFNNAGWYDASRKEWQAKTLPFSGAYSSFNIKVTKMMINGTDEYNFPEYGVLTFGEVPPSLGRPSYYRDNFSGIFMPGPGADTLPNPKPNPEGPMGLDRNGHKSTASLLETILTIEPEIVDNCFNTDGTPIQTINSWESGYDPAKDPYTYIKVRGVVHE